MSTVCPIDESLILFNPEILLKDHNNEKEEYISDYSTTFSSPNFHRSSSLYGRVWEEKIYLKIVPNELYETVKLVSSKEFLIKEFCDIDINSDDEEDFEIKLKVKSKIQNLAKKEAISPHVFVFKFWYLLKTCALVDINLEEMSAKVNPNSGSVSFMISKMNKNKIKLQGNIKQRESAKLISRNHIDLMKAEVQKIEHFRNNDEVEELLGLLSSFNAKNLSEYILNTTRTLDWYHARIFILSLQELILNNTLEEAVQVVDILLVLNTEEKGQLLKIQAIIKYLQDEPQVQESHAIIQKKKRINDFLISLSKICSKDGIAKKIDFESEPRKKQNTRSLYEAEDDAIKYLIKKVIFKNLDEDLYLKFIKTVYGYKVFIKKKVEKFLKMLSEYKNEEDKIYLMGELIAKLREFENLDINIIGLLKKHISDCLDNNKYDTMSKLRLINQAILDTDNRNLTKIYEPEEIPEVFLKARRGSLKDFKSMIELLDYMMSQHISDMPVMLQTLDSCKTFFSNEHNGGLSNNQFYNIMIEIKIAHQLFLNKQGSFRAKTQDIQKILEAPNFKNENKLFFLGRIWINFANLLFFAEKYDDFSRFITEAENSDDEQIPLIYKQKLRGLIKINNFLKNDKTFISPEPNDRIRALFEKLQEIKELAFDDNKAFEYHRYVLLGLFYRKIAETQKTLSKYKVYELRQNWHYAECALRKVYPETDQIITHIMEEKKNAI